MTDPLVWVAPRAHAPKWGNGAGTGGDLPFVMHDEGPIVTDTEGRPFHNPPAPPQPATAEQLAEVIRLLGVISGQLARLGAGR